MAFICVPACSIPSAHARRFGSESLRLAAHHGRDVAALPARRIGTAHSGVRSIMVPVPRCAVRATGSPAPAEGDEGEEFELVLSKEEMLEAWQKYGDLEISMVVDKGDEAGDCELVVRMKEVLKEKKSDLDIFDRLAISTLADKCMADQDTLVPYADLSFALWVRVTNRLSPVPGTKLYEGLELCARILISVDVMTDNGLATWKTASNLIECLDLLRRLASSGLQAPLPLDWKARFDAGLDYSYSNPEIAVEMTLKRTFVMVKLDIAYMFY